jgi:hypothetical protein
MVLAAGRTDVGKLIGGDAAGTKYAKIVVGTSDTPVSDTDSTLTGAVAKDITSVTYEANGDVILHATLASGDPAMVIKEMGILNDDDVLCHRKVIPATNKVAGTTYALTYKIKVR